MSLAPRKPTVFRVVNRDRGVVLAEVAELAAGPWGRLVGLMGRRLPPGGALALAPCRQVHTFFCLDPLDLVFFSAVGEVVGVERLPPWRVGAWHGAARGVLELPAGAAGPTRPGDRLVAEPPASAPWR